MNVIEMQSGKRLTKEEIEKLESGNKPHKYQIQFTNKNLSWKKIFDLLEDLTPKQLHNTTINFKNCTIHGEHNVAYLGRNINFNVINVVDCAFTEIHPGDDIRFVETFSFHLQNMNFIDTYITKTFMLIKQGEHKPLVDALRRSSILI